MKLEKEYLDDHQIKIRAEIESDPWEKAKYQAAKRLAKRVKIPGFRPGKAPYNVIVRNVGEAAITEEALKRLIDDVYPQVIENAEIDPYGPGTLKEVVSFDPPTFEFIIPLRPEVELSDYQAIDVEYSPPEVTDEQIDETLETLQSQNAFYETAERPAEDGDLVYLRVSAKRLDVDEPEEAQLHEERFSSARLGQENSPTDQQFFDGFSEQLLGMSAEEEKTFTHTYADDYEDEELQGAEVEFNVFVTNVQSYALPELDDDFAKTASDFETIAELRDDIRGYLEAQAAESYAEEYEDLVLQQIIEASTLKFPPQAVQDEKKNIIANLEYQLDQQNLSLGLYKQFRGLSDEEFDEEITTAAHKNVQREMVLHEIAAAEEIEPDEQELNETSEQAIKSISEQMTPKEVKEASRDGRMLNMLNNIALDMIVRRTTKYLTTIAKGEPWPPADEADEAEAGEAHPEAESSPEETETPTDAAPDVPTKTAESTPTEDESEAE